MLRGPDRTSLSVGIGNAVADRLLGLLLAGRARLRAAAAAVEPVAAAAAAVARRSVSCPDLSVRASRAADPVVEPDRAAARDVGIEFWRGRAERLPSRWPVIVIFGSFALLSCRRIPLIGMAPFPFGALPMQPGWLGAFNLVMFAHTLLLSVLMVSLSKERLELDQRTKAQTDPLTGALNRRAFMSRGDAAAGAPRLRARAAVPAVPRSRPFQVAQRSLRPFRRRRRADELRRPRERLHPADRFPVPHRRRGVLLPAAAHHHRAGASRGGAHPPPVRDDDDRGGGHGGEGHGEPRHRLDGCVRLRARHADAARRHGGLCRQARRPQPRHGGDARATRKTQARSVLPAEAVAARHDTIVAHGHPTGGEKHGPGDGRRL